MTDAWLDPRDPEVVRLHAERMAWAILGATRAAAEAVAGAAQWMSTQPDHVRAEPLPWLAAHLAEVGLGSTALAEGDHAARDELVGRLTREELRGRLAQANPAGRAALLLYDGCGYALDAVAALCRRPVEEVRALVGPDPIRTAPPADAKGRKERRRTRRRWAGVGPLLALAVVAGIVAVVTHDGGMRPTLADQPAPLDRLDEQLGCGIPPGMPVGTATFLDLELDDGVRTTRVHVPANAAPDVELPVLVVFGDFGASATATASTTGFESTAAAAGTVVVTPQALGHELSQWNVARHPDEPDDVEFVSAALDQLGSLLCLDPDRVSVVGLGNGAHFAAVWACHRPERAASVVMVEGAYLPPSCDLGGSTPLLLIASTEDEMLPVDGAFGPAFDQLTSGGAVVGKGTAYQPLSVSATLARWADESGCDPAAETATDDTATTRTSYADCRGGVAVRGLVGPFGGHGWPANATADVLSFISGQRR